MLGGWSLTDGIVLWCCLLDLLLLCGNCLGCQTHGRKVHSCELDAVWMDVVDPIAASTQRYTLVSTACNLQGVIDQTMASEYEGDLLRVPTT